MHLIYLIPAAVLWIIYGVLWYVGVPHAVELIAFGASCSATVLGLFLAGLSNVGPRF